MTGKSADSAGICAPAQLDGEICIGDGHCQQPLQLSVRNERLVRNKLHVDIGRRVRGSLIGLFPKF